VLADSEHYTTELIDHVHLETPFVLLVPMPPQNSPKLHDQALRPERLIAGGLAMPPLKNLFTIYLENNARLEHAQQMVGHESPRTTKLYDRTKDEITLSEVERIRL
jgi:hypothetical protein